MTAVPTGQLDLLAVLEQAKVDAPAPTLYGSVARGLAARAAEFAAWRDAHGSFGSFGRSHAWTVHITCPDTATERCQPTVLSADLRCDCDRPQGCCCLGDLMYRGACRRCDWEGEPHDRENAAAEDACDHAWTGWREMPVVPPVPEERTKRAAWVDRVRELYPPGWLEDGGPIRTARTGYGTRHVPGRTPFGGYDLAVAAVDPGRRTMIGPAPIALPEVATSSPWCQRWRRGSPSWRHVREGGFDACRYRVEQIDEATARGWIVANHYAASYPAACRRYGLFDGDQLVVACVLGVPMSERVLTNVFPDLEPVRESLELSRLVLADAVPGNGESWFLGRVFAAEAERGLCGVVAFADPVPRRVHGRLLFAGHTGHIYVAANVAYLGCGTARTMTVLPNGAVLSPRSAQKVRAGERGHGHVERHLVRLGATPRRPHADPAAWLTEALNELGAARIRHAGNHRYAFRLGRTARMRGRVRLGLATLPRPTSVDRPPPEQLALFPGG